MCPLTSRQCERLWMMTWIARRKLVSVQSQEEKAAVPLVGTRGWTRRSSRPGSRGCSPPQDRSGAADPAGDPGGMPSALMISRCSAA